MHPFILVTLVLQTKQAPPLGEGTKLGMAGLHTAQTSGPEHETQLRTLQLIHVLAVVNWNPNLQLEQVVAVKQTAQPGKVQFEKFPLVWFPAEKFPACKIRILE